MTPLDFIDRFTEFGGFLSNLLVCVFATYSYRNTHKRSLLFIAVSCGIAAVWMVAARVGEPSWFRWGLYTASILISDVLGVLGLWILIRDYARMVDPAAQR